MCAVGLNESGSGLPGPVGVEVPGVELVGGVVAEEDGVDARDGFGGKHLPGGGSTAHGRTMG